MSSFSNLFNRIQTLTEAKVSPYAKAHPAFGGITKKMRAGGLSAAPLDTIKFIRETLYYMDILNDDELNAIKKAPGFSGKKQAMLAALQAKQDLINQNKDAIAARIEETLDNFISGVGVNRGREEKYAAQAAAEAIAKEVRKSKSGKELDDALTDVISDETLVITASLAKVLGQIRTHLGEEGFDIEDEALTEVEDYADKISTVTQLKSFIKQIQAEPGYEKIAAYLSSIVKPVEAGLEDEEMEDEEHDYRPESVEEYPVTEKEYDEVMKSEEVAFIEVPEIYRKALRAELEELEIPHEFGLGGVEVDKVDETDVMSVLFNLKRGRGRMGSENEEGNVDAADGAMAGIKAKERLNYIDNIVSTYEGKDLDWYKKVLFKNPRFKDGDLTPYELKVLKRAMLSSEDGEGKYDDGDGKDEKCDYVPCEDSEEVVAESYTLHYLTEQAQKDTRNTAPKQETVSFKERMKPKNSWQLEELRRYGL